MVHENRGLSNLAGIGWVPALRLAGLLATTLAFACTSDGQGADAGVADAAQLDAEAHLDAAAADASEPAAPMACPRPNGEPVPGDVNGDGIHDVADAPAFGNFLFRGGPAPTCMPAADYRADGLLAIDDLSRLRVHLVSHGAPTPPWTPGACRTGDWPTPSCAPMALFVRAPAEVRSARFGAEVVVESRVRPIQAWSLSVRAEGCHITQATTAGTGAAEIWDSPPGLRHLGYTLSQPVEGGAVALTELSLSEDVVLPAAPTSVLALTVEAELPAQGCASCTLALGDGLAWIGEPLDAVLVSEGRAYRPEVAPVVISVCAP